MAEYTYIGNNAAAAFLGNAVTRDRAAHAYLITGAPQIGKRTLAHRTAAAVMCLSEPAARPCGACRACDQVGRDAHPDVLVLQPDEGHARIRVRQIRAFEHDVALKPYEAERKVAIVLGVDRIEIEAANALLKTLEEPPAGTLLLLTAAEAAQVVATIASRCQEVPLRPVPAAEIKAALVSRGAEPERAKLLSRLAGGRPGAALSLLVDESQLEARRKHLDQLEALLESEPAARLGASQSYSDTAAGRAAALATLTAWQTWWRDALLVREGCEDLVVNVDRMAALSRVTAPASECGRAVRRVQEAREQVDANANVRLAVESLLLDLPVTQAGELAGVR
jgi:DNA polymerase-3 subunit delta'